MAKPQFKKAFKLLAISASLAAVSLGGWLIYGLILKNSNQSITVQSITVSKNQVEDKITGESGVLKFNNQRMIKSPNTATIEQVLVKVGDQVKTGQILIRLRDPESQLKLQEFQADLKEKEGIIQQKRDALTKAEKNLTEAKQELAKVQNNTPREIQTKIKEQKWEIEKQKLELTKKQQAVGQAETELAEAQVKLTEDQQLFNDGFISENELQEQQKKVVAAELNVTNAKDELKLGNIELEKQNSILNKLLQDVNNGLAEAQQKVKEMQSKVETANQEVTEAKLALNQGIRDKDKLQIEREKILEELRKNLITAPFSGVILTVQVKNGDVIEQKSDLILMGDPSQQIVELKLSPLDATRIKPQQLAEISVVGLESEILTGKVQQVSLLAGEGSSDNSGNSENIKVTAVVRLDQTTQKIVPGTPVSVDLILARQKDVTVIPSNALQEDDSETFVWITDAQGKAQKKKVKIGLRGLEYIEIKSGLKENDEILIPRIDSNLKVGDSVIIKND